MSKRLFHAVDDEDIKSGFTTDVYFVRTEEVIAAKGLDKRVVVEVRAHSLPHKWPWAVLAGVEEVARLLEERDITATSLPEGTIFRPSDPVLIVEGTYSQFARFETAILGFLCQASGVATAAARCRIAAGTRPVLSFGARRMHPAIAAVIDRAAYVGGCDGVSTLAGGRAIGQQPVGTMPHALILLAGDTVSATTAFDEVVSPDMPRTALVDTFADEKFEALRVAEALGERLQAIRLDTPSSRRGDMVEILREVRWELDLRGFENVRLFVSGGLDEEAIAQLNEFADGYGVGTAISNAPTIDFSLDIVEIEGQPIAKKGKLSGAKVLVECISCGTRRVSLRSREHEPCTCGQPTRVLNLPLVRGGQIVAELPPASHIRERVIRALQGLTL